MSEYIQDKTPCKEFVQEIASLLGGDWIVGSSYGHHTLEKPSIGLVLIVCASTEKEGMYCISHQTPRVDSSGNLCNTAPTILLYKKEGTGREQFQSILVSSKKSSIQIYRDIQRRLQEEATRVQILANESIASLKIYKLNENSAIEKIKSALGVTDLNKSITPANGSFTNGYASVRVNGGGCSVEFEIHSIPLEKAEKLAKYLKQEILL